jgi:hypothetical protein
MGMLHYDPRSMTRDEAAELLRRYPLAYFDYLKGRVMKVSLKDNELDPWGYDRDNGQGAALRVIERVRAQVRSQS